MQELTGEQISQLSRALTRTVNLNDLKDFVYIATGDQLDVYWANVANPLMVVLRDLLLRLEQEGQTEAFLKTVYAKRPHRADIRQIIAALAPEAVVEKLTTPYDFVLQDDANRGTQPAPEKLAPGLQRSCSTCAFGPRASRMPVAAFAASTLPVAPPAPASWWDRRPY